MNQMNSAIEIHKFGGTSLSNAEQFQAINQIVNNDRAAIVVSATAGTTEQLQQLLDLAQQQQPYKAALTQLQDKHSHIIEELNITADNKQSLKTIIGNDCQDLDNILHTVDLLGSYRTDIQDKVLSFGELWSAHMLTELLNQTAATMMIDASNVLMTFHKHNQLHIDWDKSQQRLQQQLDQRPYQHLVITGFIASNQSSHVITLGRNGSDYSAAIFAHLLKASQLTLWTDVDGIYSADPRKVRSAFTLPFLSYEEALELAYFGAQVIHPKTIFPAINGNIPIYIKNTQRPQATGSLISNRKQPTEHLVKGLSCIDHMTLINLEGSGMTGVSGIAARVFQILHHAHISVVLISQASSEHSICLAVNQSQTQAAVTVLNEQFQFEVEQGLIKRISAQQDCAILAAVGDGMAGRPGIAGRLCDTLAKANVNIIAIAQGSSERNISLVIDHSDVNRALRAVHAGFYLSRKTISIGLIGPGQVGQVLLQQLHDTLESLKESHNVNLYVRGIMRSKQMLLDDNPINLSQWQQQFEQSAIDVDMDAFITHIAADDMPHAVIIDCTANQNIADIYPQFIKQGLHIVTPNKRANSGDLEFYQQLHQLCKNKNRFYLYETTVCAGLPVIKTLQDIIATGDQVMRIEGIVSGTLSYIFNQLSGGDSFSTIVTQAKAAGFTEPDPRDDLSGTDVARKFICLARELGFNATLDNTQVTNLVPEALHDVSVDEFLAKLPEYDQQLQQQLAPMLEKKQAPCYVGTIDQNGHIDIAIKGFDSDHPFSHLKGTDNMLMFTTKRYQQQPLVIQGPGAGTEVTAAGIFADLLRLVTALD